MYAVSIAVSFRFHTCMRLCRNSHPKDNSWRQPIHDGAAVHSRRSQFINTLRLAARELCHRNMNCIFDAWIAPCGT